MLNEEYTEDSTKVRFSLIEIDEPNEKYYCDECRRPVDNHHQLTDYCRYVKVT